MSAPERSYWELAPAALLFIFTLLMLWNVIEQRELGRQQQRAFNDHIRRMDAMFHTP